MMDKDLVNAVMVIKLKVKYFMRWMALPFYIARTGHTT
jgi:hypothetical protein